MGVIRRSPHRRGVARALIAWALAAASLGGCVQPVVPSGPDGQPDGEPCRGVGRAAGDRRAKPDGAAAGCGA
jgi:hypothetical protein